MKESQVKTLYEKLKEGVKINRVNAFQRWGIGDIRSRISDVKRFYGLTPDRQRVKGKRYLEYYINQKAK